MKRLLAALVLALSIALPVEASFVLATRVWETSATTGTSAFVLGGAQTNYRAFSAVAANADTIWYTAVNRSNPAEWESGIGTWNTGGTLSRTTVLESSNAGAAVNFGAGTKDVFSDLPPKVLNFTGAITLSSAGLTAFSSSTGSGATVLATSPALVTPDLGTPSAAVLTSATGLPISTGVSGLGSGVATFLGTPTSANLAAAVTNETGSGALVFATTPTLVTPVLGAATGTSLALGGGTALTTTNQTGTGSLVLATSPTLTTPTIGVATATSVNKVAITAPASSATLAIADGKTLTASNSLTLAGTDSTTMTFPSVSATIPRTVASGTSALGTSAIGSGACATVVTTSATGVATTDVIHGTFNADPTSTTGYSASANGMLTIIGYPTANNVNWKVCNNTAASITPGAVTLNWQVIR